MSSRASIQLSQAAAFAGLGIATDGSPIEILETIIIDHDHPNPLDAIAQAIEQTIDEPQVSLSSSQSRSPEDAGWLMMLGYELGALIEPKAKFQDHNIHQEHPFPLAVLQRWVKADQDSKSDGHRSNPGFTLGDLASQIGKEAYIKAVERTKEYIRAGDIYQANIAHQLVGEFTGNTKLCFDQLSEFANPRMGAMMLFDYLGDRHAVLSVSPEVFVECDFRSGLIRTEPMKGTRPLGSDPRELKESIKDRAELDMITDLMRNDIGRLCTPGSVRVLNPRQIEAHQSGVLQASSQIEGRLEKGVGIIDLIRATFPPGSITGAPKVRAMQIIDELEQFERASYCGSMMVLNDAQVLKASVTIRTAHIWGKADPDSLFGITDGQFVYPVGAGIVADSEPIAEWEETLIKAKVLVSALGSTILDDR